MMPQLHQVSGMWRLMVMLTDFCYGSGPADVVIAALLSSGGPRGSFSPRLQRCVAAGDSATGGSAVPQQRLRCRGGQVREYPGVFIFFHELQQYRATKNCSTTVSAGSPQLYPNQYTSARLPQCVVSALVVGRRKDWGFRHSNLPGGSRVVRGPWVWLSTLGPRSFGALAAGGEVPRLRQWDASCGVADHEARCSLQAGHGVRSCLLGNFTSPR
mmetsp:Transcript_38980/g.102107  ORF Transcript_38980/g.102107 Transcript_38980/m.102107 type:complete len:214 (-) Transcript_38980:310-951(-)